ncbi:MAG TPA: flagellar hook-basal body complex protein FliE [Pirellulaceae bacterium]|nr:flagellar hook-basal body complex protein FliE [Pirellulaceae bacterium]
MTPISSIPLVPSPTPLAPIQSPGAAFGAQAAGDAAQPASGNTTQPFQNILLEALDQVNSMQHEANQAVQQLVTGGDANPAEVLTTLQKADMSFKLMLQIRNKLVQAYQEVNNIRI